jgi:hypothetical protein
MRGESSVGLLPADIPLSGAQLLAVPASSQFLPQLLRGFLVQLRVIGRGDATGEAAYRLQQTMSVNLRQRLSSHRSRGGRFHRALCIFRSRNLS